MTHHEDKHTVRRCGIVCGLTSLSLGCAGKAWQAGLFGLAAGIWSIATLIRDRRDDDD